MKSRDATTRKAVKRGDKLGQLHYLAEASPKAAVIGAAVVTVLTDLFGFGGLIYVGTAGPVEKALIGAFFGAWVGLLPAIPAAWFLFLFVLGSIAEAVRGPKS